MDLIRGLIGLKRKKVVRRKKPMKGKGFGSFLSDLGSGLGSGTFNLAKGLIGLKRRSKRGRGEGDAVANMAVAETKSPGILSKVNNVLRKSQILSKGLKEFGYDTVGDIASKVGYRKRKSKRGGAHNLTF